VLSLQFSEIESPSPQQYHSTKPDKYQQSIENLMTDEMGNKNFRGNAAFNHRAPNVPPALPPMMAPTQPSGSVNTKAENTAGSSKLQGENKPVTLPFRSYQTGTLHTPHFAPSGSGPAQNSATHGRKRLSATSAAFVPSSSSGGSSPSESPTIAMLKSVLSPSETVSSGLSSMTQLSNNETALTTPTGPRSNARLACMAYDRNRMYYASDGYQFIREFTTREDKSRKDVVIIYQGIHHNIIGLHEVRDKFGNVSFMDNGDYANGSYYLEYELEGMTPKERSDFWITNWVEIDVDIQIYNNNANTWDHTKEEEEAMCDERTMKLVNIMNELGPEFAASTRTVFISIRFPEETPETPEYLLQDLQEQMQSRPYRTLQNICNKLKEFTSLQRLEIVLHTQAHSRNPVALAQLHFALPFYELPFTKWQLKWQNTYMSRPEPIRGWSITHLNIERAKIDRNLARGQELEPTEKVFVRASASPAVHDLPFASRDKGKLRSV
jgi:hypothetical protein